MKTINTIAAHLLLLAYPIYAANVSPPPAATPETVYSTAVGKSAVDVIEYFEGQEPTTSADFFTLALAHYSRADFQRALGLATQAFAIETKPSARSVCIQLIAECHGALGQYALASEAALLGVHQNPDSKELAALRLAYTHEAKDALGEMAARDHLAHLDSTFAKNPKIAVGTVILIYLAAKIVIALLVRTADPETQVHIRDSLHSMAEMAKSAEIFSQVLMKWK